MTLRADTPVQSIALPSFRDLIKTISSPDRQAPARLLKYPHCNDFVSDLADHVAELHPRQAERLSANKHETSTDNVDEGFVFGSRSLSAVSQEPFSIGWFDATVDRAKKTYSFVRDCTCDELWDLVWEIDESRPLYRDQPDPKRGRSSRPFSASDAQDLTLGDQRRQQSKQNHTDNERNRRTRHGEYQSKLHIMTPEIAHRLADADADLAGKKSTSSKGPGKDHQFVSDLYMRYLIAIVLQSEHEARLSAERRVEELNHEVRRLRDSHPVEPSHMVDDDPHYRRDASPPKRRRRSANSEPGNLLRLPPSPSPSPSIRSFKAHL